MIRKIKKDELEVCCNLINDSAQAYKGIIAPDCWHEPYMPLAEFKAEVAAGVEFWVLEEQGALNGLMGIQDRGEVTLFRHAYVRTACRRQGVGGLILDHLKGLTKKPVLIGTWGDAVWAIRFYEKHGYRLVTWAEKERLLRQYWSLPPRQIETSVVLADEKWFSQKHARN